MTITLPSTVVFLNAPWPSHCTLTLPSCAYSGALKVSAMAATSALNSNVMSVLLFQWLESSV